MEILASGMGMTEGPVVVRDDAVALVSVTAGAVFIVTTGGEVQPIDTGGGPNGMCIDAEGTLYVAQNGGIWGAKPGIPGGVQRIRDRTVDQIVDSAETPNDICFGPDGRLYFTDTRGESNPDDPSTARPGRLYACEPDGSSLKVVLEGPAFINGLAFDRDGTHLLVVETGRKRLLRYDFSDGELTNEQEFCKVEQGYADGIALDTDGNVWVASTYSMGIHVFDESGELQRFIDLGEGAQPTNCCFGPPGSGRLYIAAAGLGALGALTVEAEGLPLYPLR